MITFRIMWQDLNEQAKQRVLKAFGDNGNWDVIPMAILQVESPKNIVLDSCCGDYFDGEGEGDRGNGK